MTTASVAQYLFLLDQAFDGSRWHSLLGNLDSVDLRVWTCVPPGGDRSIRDIVEHAGACKIMYENHAFGDAHLTWDDQFIDGDLSTVSTATEWLRQCHERLIRSVASLSDRDLLVPRKLNWGELGDTRWIISIMIEHDLPRRGDQPYPLIV
jgi:DinB superfamily